MLQTDNDQPRRGSRGSILSGKANVEPNPMSTTIPTHHLAQLSMSTSSDYVSISAQILIKNIDFKRSMIIGIRRQQHKRRT
jgi:hypothetical protein